MAIIDYNTAIGQWFMYFVGSTAGNAVGGLLALMLILVIMALSFRIPLEVTFIILLPYAIIALFITSAFMPILGTMLIYLAIVLAVRAFWN